jgi:hypothetical protein
MLTFIKSSLKWTVICACLLFAPLSVTHAQTGDDPGYAYVKELGLVQEFNLTQTQSDITATIARIYADENRVVIEYGVSTVDPALLSTLNMNLQLTDGNGATFEAFSGGGGGDTSNAVFAYTSFRPSDDWLTVDRHLFITFTPMEDVTFEFEVEVNVQPAVRLLWDETIEVAGVPMHLLDLTVAQSMTTLTVCYDLLTSGSWLPRGTISVPSDTLTLRTGSPHSIDGETCVRVYGVIPYIYGITDPQPITLDIAELVTPRPRTLDNFMELQTRAEELGITVEIRDTGDPINYSYSVSDFSPEFSALFNDVFFERIVGHWTFVVNGIP